ncbi:MAG TPA: DUF5320 domain-containing protein [Clostridiales bacterium]|nr:DUF5320 domain-containing protein [Clostridiales bacterium]
MPRMDGTGPMGAGSMTGRGLGLACRRGLGRGRGRGFDCSLAINQTSSKTQKEQLEEHKTMLQKRLEVIKKQLENL